MKRAKLHEALLSILAEKITTHTCADGSFVASTKLDDGRVLRVVGFVKGAVHPSGELFKTLFLEVAI